MWCGRLTQSEKLTVNLDNVVKRWLGTSSSDDCDTGNPVITIGSFYAPAFLMSRCGMAAVMTTRRPMATAKAIDSKDEGAESGSMV